MPSLASVRRSLGGREGEGLGKKGEGIVNPLDLLVKRNRLGLGLGDEAFESATKKAKGDGSGNVSLDETVQRFRQTQENNFKERRLNGQLKAAVNVCLTLDKEKGLTDNGLLPAQFMPPEEAPEDLEELQRLASLPTLMVGHVPAPPDSFLILPLV